MARSIKLSRSALLQAIATKGLNLLPFPRHITIRGAPFTMLPGGYIHVAVNATEQVRKTAHLFSTFMKDLQVKISIATTQKLEPSQAVLSNSATLPPMSVMNDALRGEARCAEGYRLVVNPDGVMLHGADDAGLHNSVCTLKQLLEDGPQIPGLDIADYPLVRWRAMHLDCKGWPPNLKYLKRVIEMFSAIKINALVLEYESHFNFKCLPGVSGSAAFSAADVAELDNHARDHGITLIPLVQCMGNVGHILSVPRYAELREHPRYFQMFCAGNEVSLNLVGNMIDELIPCHAGKFFHLGGDEARLLGSHPMTDARVKELKGRLAVYLDYFGKLAKYMLGRSRAPLLWDDEFRQMTDAQIKWLPPETILTVWQFEGHGGKASTALLKTLERYQSLGRKVWGAATRTPTARYDALDNIDAWTEASEARLIDGLMTTAWTRDHSLGGMYAPPEISWPAVYYAAERSWFGMKELARDMFPQRFISRMYGLRNIEAQSRLWAAHDLLMRDHPRRARPYVLKELEHVTRNKDTLLMLDGWCSLLGFREAVAEIGEEVGENLPRLRAGRADPLNAGRLRWRVQALRSALPALVHNFEQRGLRITNPEAVREFLESGATYSLERLREFENWLAAYPMPDESLRPTPDL